MTTVTKASDPVAELTPIREKLEAARQERARLGVESRAWQDGIGKLERDLVDLARDDPVQFANGFPKQKTKAAELRAEIDKRANGHKWPEIIGGADARIRSLEAELSRRTEANAEALARHEYEGRGTANAEKWRQIATLILEADGEYTASAQYQMGIAISVTGLDGRDVFSDPVVGEARKLADRLAEVQPPRSVSLAPLPTEDPARVKSVNGGYIGAGVNAGDIAEDQPERVELVL
jgi:antitoxin (DNA-binding transcriptional repressor) of toxin-antitoxin stability system